MIYKLLPYKLHRWLILKFGKPVDCGCYQLHGWVAGTEDCIYTANVWEIHKRLCKEIAEAFEKYNIK